MSDLYRLEEHTELEKPLVQQIEAPAEAWENELPRMSKRRIVGFTILVAVGFAVSGIVLIAIGTTYLSIAGALLLILAVTGIIDAVRPGGGWLARTLLSNEFRSWPFGSSWKEYESPSSKDIPPRDV